MRDGSHGIIAAMAELRSSRQATFLFGIAVTAALLVAYANSFKVGFYFDDTYGIVENPSIRTLTNVPRLFVDPYAYWTDYTQPDMRPILMTSYAVNYAISGLDPWSYHVLNLVLHVIAAILVFVLVRDELWPSADGAVSRPVIAAAIAFFFALAPLNSQPVIYLWARSALLCTVFYLAAFLAFLKGRRVSGALFHALALGTKAIALSLPGVLLAHAFFYRDRTRHPRLASWLRDWRNLVQVAAIPSAIDALYLVYRKVMLPANALKHFHEAWVTPWIWFMSQWAAQLNYVRLFLWPSNLSADHDFPYTTSLFTLRAIVSLAIIAIWVAGALIAAKKHPQVAFATSWFFLTLAPESSFSPLAEVVNDHRPYIASSLGLSVLLGWLVLTAVRRFSAKDALRPFIATSALLCLVSLPVTIRRTREWGDSLRLWASTVRASPKNGRAWMNAGREYMGRGDYKTARRYFDKALELAPNYAVLRMNVSVLEGAEGHRAESIAAAREAVRLRPDLSRSHYFLGLALEKDGQRDAAAAAYRRALDLESRDQDAKAALERMQRDDRDPQKRLMADGVYALYNDNDPNTAIAAFEKVLQLNPAHYGATFQIARAYDEAGRPDIALTYWNKALPMAVQYEDKGSEATIRTRLQRNSSGEERTLMSQGLEALYQKNDPARASDLFRRVLRLNPEHYGATYQIGVALDRSGSRDEARPYWEKMLAMAEGINDATTVKTARARLSQR